MPKKKFRAIELNRENSDVTWLDRATYYVVLGLFYFAPIVIMVAIAYLLYCLLK